jgi:hypothetical protein
VFRTHTVEGGIGRNARRQDVKGNARGSDDDRRQIIADLLSDDRSPFTPEDLDALNLARDEILRHWRDEWLGPKKAKAQQQHRTNCDGIDKGELQTMVSEAVAEAFASLTGHGITTNKEMVDTDTDADPAADLDELAKEAERAGNTEKARKLRKAADDRRASDRARARGHQSLAANARFAANVAKEVDADDEDVKAMSEFGSADAVTKAINAKHERQAKGE